MAVCSQRQPRTTTENNFKEKALSFMLGAFSFWQKVDFCP
jgi:hypothetical protein